MTFRLHARVAGGFSGNRAKALRSLLPAAVVGITLVLLTGPYAYLAPLPGLVLAALFLLSRYPRAGYTLLIFLIPFGAYRSLSGPLEFIRVHWFIALWLVLVVFYREIGRKRIPAQIRCGLWPFLLLFLGVTTIAAFLSEYPQTAFKHLFLLTAAYLFIVLNLIFIEPRIFWRGLPGVLVWSVSLGALFAILGFFLSIEGFGSEPISGEYQRGTGGTLDPNNMSLMIIFVIPLLAFRLFHSQSRRPRILAGALIMLNLLALATTYSRGGTLVLLAVTVLLLVEHLRALRPARIAALLGIVLVTASVIAVSLPESFWHRQKSILGEEDVSIGRRKSYWLVAWEAFNLNPLFGSGPGSFRDIYGTSEFARHYAREEEQLYRFAHNTYLEILVGSGVLGLGLFLALLWKAWRNFSRARQRFLQRGEQAMASLVGSYRLAFAVVLIYLLIFSDPYHKYLLLSLALSEAALRFSPSEAIPGDDGIHEGV